MKFKAIVHPEEGGFWAEVPALPGCFTQAETLEEIKTNLKEAIEGILDYELDPTSLEVEHSQVIEIEV
jgi:predicted RNase H-like HicB family nuclease